MKKLALLFTVLLATFLGVWILKSKTPTARPDDLPGISNKTEWWADEDNLPKADAEWVLDPEIPENYIPVPGADELYMVINDKGLIIEYRQRTLQEDGSWLWKTVNPDIPENYEAVEGLTDIYKVVGPDGKVSYFKYIRNEDDTFAFVPVDENGKVIEEKKPSGEEIPANYKRITGNIYAVYDENNVIIGYKERSIDEKGNYIWNDCEKPVKEEDTSSSESKPEQDSSKHESKPSTPNNSGGNSGNTNNGNANNSGTNNNNGDGSYTETETITTTETKGGFVYTYQTTITRKYDSEGKLLSTNKDGPNQISCVPIGESDIPVPDKSLIKPTLSEELARIKVGLNFQDDLVKEILTIINTQRQAEHLAPLVMGETELIVAQIRAADMAIYNHADYDSAMYGTAKEMCERFGLNLKPNEILRSCAGDNATAIASSLQMMSGTLLMDASYSSIGMAIVSKKGYYYIDIIIH